MAALSDSTVIKDCSALMMSPTLTNISMIDTSLKSPMSGTLTSTGPAATAGAPAAAGATVCAAGAGVATAAAGAGEAGATGADTAASPATSNDKTMEPSLTLPPTATLTSFTTPAWLEGISIDALSLSTVRMD